MYDVLIIGGGAAGMMCAVTAARMGASTAVAEHNARLGRKLGITGKGRCNVTNNCDRDTILKNIPHNARFLYSALSGFSAQDTMSFFEELGVPLKTERGNRVFPQSDKAGDIVNALADEMNRLGVEIIRGSCKALLINDGVCTGTKINGKTVEARSVILATGGLSYPATGCDGSGYTLAKQAGHTVIPPEPSLVPMLTEESWTARAAGLRLRNIAMKITDSANGKKLYEDFGELEFTSYGVSGPTVLSASAYIPKPEKGRYVLTVDLKPALSEKQLDARILRDFGERSGSRLSECLRGLLPAPLCPIITELSGIDGDKRVDEISRAERQRLGSLLKALELHIAGFRPIDEAIITRGGVSVKEINPKTMQSSLCGGLFFAGEIIDCDAYTGGFNLQIAFSTAFAAATAAAGGEM
ncbi:MAG: NAD(P)/FAD-dependent oxidoreductase [Oscillospiraceae bacterium]